MKNLRKNFGSKHFKGREWSVSIIILAAIFCLLFIGGAAMLWRYDESLQDPKNLETGSTTIEELLLTLQSEMESGDGTDLLEPIDDTQYQAVRLENGEWHMGKAKKDETGQSIIMTKIEENSEENSNEKQLKIPVLDVRAIRNVPAAVMENMRRGN